MALTPPFSRFSAMPEATGLFDPRNERDACGLAMVATLRGTAGHDIIATALQRAAQPRAPRRGRIGCRHG